MSKNGFFSGFLIGALFGGAIGGAIGAVVASHSGTSPAKRRETSRRSADPSLEPVNPDSKRRELEAKIAHLNDTIDDVREQLQVVHHSAPEALSDAVSAVDAANHH